MSWLTSVRNGELEETLNPPGLSYGEKELRWGFIRKVYGILASQIILTTIVSSVTVLYSPINELLNTFVSVIFLSGFFSLLLFFACLPSFFICSWYIFHYNYSIWHFVFHGLLITASTSISVGVVVALANTQGKVLLEALILTSAGVSALTGYTFWVSSKPGKDFDSYLEPFLFSSVIVLILTGFIQMFFPLGPTSVAIYGALGAMGFSGYLVYRMDNLLKRFDYDMYILASTFRYLSFINLFFSIFVLGPVNLLNIFHFILFFW